MKHLLLICCLALLSVGAKAQVAPAPSLLQFQGRLARPDGTPVADGSYTVRFSLWNAAAGGSEQWNQTINALTVRNGTLATLLSGFPANAFDGDLWLEIKVNSDAPLTPRQQLVSVAYAMKANTVPDGSITSAKLASGAVTSANLAAGTLNPLAWLLGGNSGPNPASHFLGTTDNKALEFRVNSVRALRLEPNASGVNVLGGTNNTIASGVASAIVLGFNNAVNDSYGTVGGGQLNRAGNNDADVNNRMGSTVSGGISNVANGGVSTIAGGVGNRTFGYASIVAGGENNIAGGDYSFAAGRRAQANAAGAFVWADSQNADFVADIADTFVIRAGSGMGINLRHPYATLHMPSAGNHQIGLLIGDQTPIIGVHHAELLIAQPTNVSGHWPLEITRGSSTVYGVREDGSVFSASSRRYKEHIAPLPNALERVLKMQGVTFDWKPEFGGRHDLGFVAEDLGAIVPELVEWEADGKAARGVRYDRLGVLTIEAIKDQQKQIAAQKTEIAELKAQVQALTEAVRQLQEQRR